MSSSPAAVTVIATDFRPDGAEEPLPRLEASRS
jgi:hypothetical protein